MFSLFSVFFSRSTLRNFQGVSQNGRRGEEIEGERDKVREGGRVEEGKRERERERGWEREGEKESGKEIRHERH